ncbi:MAG: hypothetical protein WCC04_14375 [Terriglobales bacterium]
MTAILLLASCGGSTANVQNPGPPNQQQVSIAFSQAPPTAISLGSTTLPTVSATVSNDPTNDGVTWELVACQGNGSNCSAGVCTITPSGATPCGVLLNSSGQKVAHSASGDTLTYQLPSTFPLPGDALLVEIVALATYNQAVNVTAPITITAFGSVLQGTYVFQAQGNDSTGSTYPYQIAGQIYLDGSGNVTTPSGGTSPGQQTINTYDVNGNLVSTTTKITSGSYFVGTDGRGTLILNTTDDSADAITEIFSLVVISSSEVSIAQLGGTLTNSQGTSTLSQSGSGTLELQDAGAAGSLPTGGYAFVASGTDYTGSTPIVFGGVLNIDGSGSKNNPCTGPGCISGNGSLADMDSANDTALVTCSNGNAPFGEVSQSTTGVVTFALSNASNCFNGSAIQFTGYIVDSTHIRLIETDDSVGAGGFLTAGPAVGQSSPGTLTSFSGQYVWTILGTDLNSGPVPSSLTSLGVVNADGAGNAAGITDTLFLSWPGDSSNIPFGDLPFTATYQVESDGIGRALMRFSPPPKSHFVPDIVFYLTGSATPPLVLYAAAGNLDYPALGVGITYPQQQPPDALAFGNGELYGFSFAQTNGSENDGSGQITANAGASGDTLTGVVDDFTNNVFLESGNPPSPPFPINDTYTCGASTCADSLGRIAGTFMAPLQTPPATLPSAEYYLIDPSHGLFTETDVVNSSQVTLGYFGQRCDVTSAASCQQAAAKASRKRAVKTRRSGMRTANSYALGQEGRNF